MGKCHMLPDRGALLFSLFDHVPSSQVDGRGHAPSFWESTCQSLYGSMDKQAPKNANVLYWEGYVNLA